MALLFDPFADRNHLTLAAAGQQNRLHVNVKAGTNMYLHCKNGAVEAGSLPWMAMPIYHNNNWHSLILR
jgi:hypothetical protein